MNSPEPPVGIWLATASMLLLVEDIVVCDMIWKFRKVGWRKILEKMRVVC